MGMDDYLSKPVEYTKLIALFYKYLKISKDKHRNFVIGGAKELKDNSKGVLVDEYKSKSTLNPLKDHVNQLAKELKPVSRVRKEYNGDDSLSFKERVEASAKKKQETRLKAAIDQYKTKDEEPKVDLKTKLTTIDNFSRKNKVTNEPVKLMARGTFLEPTESKGNQLITIIDYNYDRATACKYIGVDELTLDMLLDNFALSYRKDLEKIQKALEAKVADDVVKTAHYMKGSVANLRMNSLADLLKEVEINARSGIISKVDFNSINKYIEAIIMD